MELGFVGAGRMGRPMVRRLVEAGHRVRVYVRDAEVRTSLARDGAEPVTSLTAAARGADAVLLCVLTDAQVREVCLDGALVPALPDGSVLAVHTTGDPRTVRTLAHRGADVVDVPVSGGPHDVEAGRLTVFAGGEEQAVERVRPALCAYADPVLHVGALGAGQGVKLVNNTLFAAQLGLLAQAVRLGRDLGVEESVLLAALAQGSAAGNASAASAARGGVAGLVAGAGPFLRKDLAVAADLTGALGLSLGPLSPAVRSLRGLLPEVD
ncbi:NAD(P)-dependent oxidoreductase [Streptomyces mutabilis]|uniref:NAD(P)-dependent oxidoreductase n=1 Tax=Streptomyces mutabilis TaxID=67332 RepID=UPI0017830D8B|nr:NAD(P)-dependent oxidoreductase [Streptomyces mutabilis]GGQ33517.1 6-phosphogluconate dehydrogenase [Streptomyces mutabilis]